MVLDGVVLRGQAEGVIPHGEEHIVAVHAALAGHHVHGGVGPGVAHMQALSGGIGELHQGIELGFGVVDLTRFLSICLVRDGHIICDIIIEKRPVCKGCA